MHAMPVCIRRPRLLPTMLAASLALPATASAQTEISAAELQRCAAIERGVQRLDCYDALAQTRGASPASETVSVPAEARTETYGAPTEAGPEPATPAERGATASPGDVDEFGAELIRSDSDENGVDEIESRIVGKFTGWSGNTTFRLENGQVWQQIELTRFTYRADSPVVTIRRGTFGGYRLRVDGLNRSVRVRRIE